MPDDTTKAIRVNEKWTLLAMLAVVAIAGGAVWRLGYWDKLAAPSTTLPTAATQKGGGAVEAQDALRPRRRDWTRRPMPEPPGDYIQWPDELENQGTTVIRVGNVHLNLSLSINGNRKIVDARWGYPRQEPSRPGGAGGAGVGAANMAMRVLADPKLAARYDFTAEQLEQLKKLKFTLPELAAEDKKKMTELFLAAARARTQWRTQVAKREKNPSLPEPEKEKMKFVEAELLLKVAAGKLAVPPHPPTEMDAADETEEQARKLLRPDQLDLIDSGFDRTDGSPDRPSYLRRLIR
ncbi:MAG: hypothetical protein FWD61_02645 [Phycisphaerales bacterium]|nr:hypothetical protein [Phycisphaerales bacterium]